MGAAMIAAHIALLAAGAFLGAALYLNLVEQPSRLGLDDSSLLKEWTPSDRRGFALMAALALISGALGLAEFAEFPDVRWAAGALFSLASWLYAYFVLVPMNNRILTLGESDGAAARAFIRDWGRLEWGQTALGAAACAAYVWALNP
jgi:hypothetical protein